MKKLILLIILLLISFNVGSARAEELDAERELLICALSSMAAYSDETGDLSRRFFEARGWKLEKFENPSKKINVKIYFMSNEDAAGNIIKIVFVTGTEELKDVLIDTKISSAPFNSDEKILVHKGFRDYADAALSDGNLEFLVEYINSHPAEKIYFTGHSLGGAISILIAARLADAGTNMKNIKVVTFGAPAVGNKSFGDFFQDKINLMRVVMNGDHINGALKIFGYPQFGKVINYKKIDSADQYSHSMAVYLDSAMRNFYDAKFKFRTQNKVETPVYIAPVKIVKKSFKPAEENYIKSILRDGYESRFANATFAEPNFETIKKDADFSYSVKEYVDAAKKSGSKFIIVPLIHSKPIKESEKRATRVLIEEIICDAQGHLISMNTSGMTTVDVTILDAAFFGQEFLREDREKTVSGK